jgi:soluble P-type ATPase
MRRINIPNYGVLTIKNILFDVNGTIQFKGMIADESIERFKELKKFYTVYLVSADTRGNLKEIAQKLNIEFIKIESRGMTEAEAKNNELMKLGKEVTIAIGNGNNDALMLKNALLGIVVVGREGLTTKCLMNSDVILPDISSVLDFLLDEKIMIATLRS